MMNGIINIYKERGFTSHDVVAKMRGICGQKKIGHTGTLDPYATGVLPVCLGNGTKLCDLLTDKDKEYVAELLLGQDTDTQDVTGEVLSTAEVTVTEEMVRESMESFVGEYDQIPPMYSAIKVDGKKLYELARQGKTIEREARRVKILELEILEMKLPVVKFRVVCSKGTYIRTLCKDIGDKLGCFGTMQSLERTRVGRFTTENAITLSELQKLKDCGALESKVLAVDDYFDQLPKVIVNSRFKRFLENGNSFRKDNVSVEEDNQPGTMVRVYSDERFFGLYSFDIQKDCYLPVKMFL